jgi:co-chaperonin GroES (HSP10)
MPTAGIDIDQIETHLRLPLDWILVRLDPPIRRTRGGIELPDAVTPPARTGVVVTRGPGALSDDGKTRMPVSCSVGERIMFEVGAGKALPLVARETTSKGWGYRLIRDGSVCATVDPIEPTDEDLPPAPSRVPVSHRGSTEGAAWTDRLRPVQDWLLVRMDDRATELEVRRGGAPLVGLDGRPLKLQLGPDRDQQQREDTWTVEVLRRGPGLTTITRCIDGDRLNHAPHLVEVGERALAAGTAPNVQPVAMDEQWSAPGMTVLMREYPCILGVVERAA